MMRSPALAVLLVVAAGCGGGEDTAITAAGTTAPSPAVTAPATTTAAPSTTTAAVPFEPWLVVQGGDGERTLIDTIGADGAHRHIVATLPRGDQTNPDWSPDGSRLTFVLRAADGTDDLWVADADGSNAVMLFDCAGDCIFVDDPAWSPDGSTIATCQATHTSDGDVGTLLGVDVATGTATTLVELEPRDFCAGTRWSPDGSAVVQEVVHAVGTDIDAELTGVTLSVFDLTTTPPTALALTDPARFAATADWNDSGDLIVYAALATPADTATDLFVIAPDGTGERRLTDGVAASEPAFRHDQATVAFVADGDGDAPTLQEVPLAGGAPKLLEVACPCRHPRFRPGSP